MLLGSLIIVTLAALICTISVRMSSPERYLYRMTTEFEEMEAKFLASSSYHREVAATLAYLDQIQERPELLQRLGKISREVLAASLLQRMGLIAATLAVMHQKLELSEKAYASYGYTSQATLVTNIRREIAKLQADQQALHQLCELLGGVTSAA
jgi:hypothetical protein